MVWCTYDSEDVSASDIKNDPTWGKVHKSDLWHTLGGTPLVETAHGLEQGGGVVIMPDATPDEP